MMMYLETRNLMHWAIKTTVAHPWWRLGEASIHEYVCPYMSFAVLIRRFILHEVVEIVPVVFTG